MTERSLTPNITVTIGHHTRIYFAFVTTAPAELDSPATVTLHSATFADVAGFAADPITLDEAHGRISARLILVDAMELAWQRASIAATSINCFPLIPGSLASTRCSTGCGNAFRRPLPARLPHEPLNSLVGVNRSPQWRAFQEVTL